MSRQLALWEQDREKAEYNVKAYLYVHQITPSMALTQIFGRYQYPSVDTLSRHAATIRFLLELSDYKYPYRDMLDDPDVIDELDSWGEAFMEEKKAREKQAAAAQKEAEAATEDSAEGSTAAEAVEPSG